MLSAGPQEWQVGYSSQLGRATTTRAVSSVMSPGQALQAMLSGTGISIRATGPRSAALVDPASTSSAQTPSSDSSIVLDTIDVSGKGDRNASSGPGYLGAPDWVYETPGSVAVISREAIQNSGVRNTRELMNLPAGVYSGEGQGSFPTVSPNIRGVQDSGRVVVSIDGARQNAQDGGRYGSNSVANSGGAFVDTAFVREINIDKNPGARVGTAGALAGTVNFRTVGAQDLIKPGKTWGIEADVTRGTNEHNFQGSVLGSAKITDNLWLTSGFSRLRLGDYEPGKYGEVKGTGIANLTRREAWSSLLKLEGEFGDVKTSLSWMHQQNDFAYTPSGASDDFKNRLNARNDSVVGDIAWAPGNPLINVKGKLWLNDSMVHETRDARVIGLIPLARLKPIWIRG